MFRLLLTAALAGCLAPAQVPASAGKTSPSPETDLAPELDSPEKARADLLLAAAADDKNPDVRRQAIACLGLVGPREPYLSRLYEGLKDKDVYVRLTAVSALLDMNDKSTLGELRGALKDEAPEVSFSAARALWLMGDPEGRDALLAVIDKESKTASNFLTAQKRDTLRMFHTPKTLILFLVKQGVGFAPVPGLGAGISSLEDILTDTGVSGRATAILLLGSDRSPEVSEVLKDSLYDKDPLVRAAAVHALALRDDPALMPLIHPLMDDPKPAVRLRAAAGYLRLNLIRRSPALGAARRRMTPAQKQELVDREADELKPDSVAPRVGTPGTGAPAPK